MSVHRYAWPTLVPDYLRAGLGLAATLGPLLFVHPSSVMLGALSGLAVLFFLFGLRTVLRQGTRIEVDPDGISVIGPFRERIEWGELRDVSVRYFSTRRDRSHGWMQLTLKGANASIRVDSSISGFRDLVAQAVGAARRRDVRLSERTLANIGELQSVEGAD